jgi:hypothetical protein
MDDITVHLSSPIRILLAYIFSVSSLYKEWSCLYECDSGSRQISQQIGIHVAGEMHKEELR